MANQSGFPVWGPDKTHLWLQITPSILDLKQKSKWQTSFKSWDLSKNALKPANFQFTCPLDFFQHKWRQTVRLLLRLPRPRFPPSGVKGRGGDAREPHTHLQCRSGRSAERVHVEEILRGGGGPGAVEMAVGVCGFVPCYGGQNVHDTSCSRRTLTDNNGNSIGDILSFDGIMPAWWSEITQCTLSSRPLTRVTIGCTYLCLLYVVIYSLYLATKSGQSWWCLILILHAVTFQTITHSHNVLIPYLIVLEWQ